ncbi:thioredoxin family protein [Kaarinaea lacus]
MNTQSLIFETHYETFEKDIIEASHDKPILVDLWAEWCAPCHTIAPILEKVVHAYNGAVALAKLEVDEGENMKIAGRYAVRGFPTVLLIQDGEETGRFSGAKPIHFVEDFIASHTQLTP